MVPLERSLAELVRAELVPLDAARGVATDPTALDDYLRAQPSRRDP
jgi:hypothetical protein